MLSIPASNGFEIGSGFAGKDVFLSFLLQIVQGSEQTAGQGANRLCQVLTSLEVSITMSSIWIKLGM